MSPRIPLRRCVVCREIYQRRDPAQTTCSDECRARLVARELGPGEGARVIVRLDDPRCGERRLGTVITERPVHGRPLLTVRLDRGGWPGGNYGGHPPAGWYADLRPNEVELA